MTSISTVEHKIYVDKAKHKHADVYADLYAGCVPMSKFLPSNRFWFSSPKYKGLYTLPMCSDIYTFLA